MVCNIVRMSLDVLSTHDRAALDKFARYLTLKVAQIIVQSRQGKKIVSNYNEPPHGSPDSRTSPLPQVQLGVDSVSIYYSTLM